MSRSMRDEPSLGYEDLSPEIAEQQRVGRPAGVYLLEGRYHVANRASAAERGLLARGALLVAGLVFRTGAAERAVSGGSPAPAGRATALVPLLNREAAGAIRPSPSDN